MRLQIDGLPGSALLIYQPESRLLVMSSRNADAVSAYLNVDPVDVEPLREAGRGYGIKLQTAVREFGDIYNKHPRRVLYEHLDELMSERAQAGAKLLARSLSDRQPWSWRRATMPNGVRELCRRDSECAGSHRWLFVQSEREFIWHLNLDTGAAVPPGPMVLVY